MEFRRSIVGTIVFALLAFVHSPAFWLVGTILYNYNSIDLWELCAHIFQIITVLLYIAMIFVPLKSKGIRIAVAIVFMLSFLDNVVVFFAFYKYYKVLDLIALSLVILDLLVIIALVTKPTNKLNKLTPFYAENSIESAI